MVIGGAGSEKLECTLRRTEIGFAGIAVGRVGFFRMRPPNDSAERRVELPIQMPTDVVEDVLRLLATMAIVDAPYRPTRVPDYRIHTEFTISTDAGPVRVFNDSPGLVGRVPWAVVYNGKHTVTDAGIPREAYRRISPYLAELRKMTQNELRTLIEAPAPPPSPATE